MIWYDKIKYLLSLLLIEDNDVLIMDDDGWWWCSNTVLYCTVRCVFWACEREEDLQKNTISFPRVQVWSTVLYSTVLYFHSRSLTDSFSPSPHSSLEMTGLESSGDALMGKLGGRSVPINWASYLLQYCTVLVSISLLFDRSHDRILN